MRRSSSAANGFTVSFPEKGRVVFHNPRRFSSWRSESTRHFLEASLGVREVNDAEIDTSEGTASLAYEANGNWRAVVEKIAGVYRGEIAPDYSPTLSPEALRVVPGNQSRLRVFRYGQILSTWELRMEMPGWLRLRNALILNKKHLVRFLERELTSMMGITRYKTHAGAGSVTIEYDHNLVHQQQIVHQLDLAMSRAPSRIPKTRRVDAGVPVATASLALATVTTFFAPAMLPAGAALMLYTSIPSFKRAFKVLFRERRMGVDVLDSIIFTACLFTGQIFAGAMTAWFLTFGRKLLSSTGDDSAKILLHAFGKQPSVVWLLCDGNAVETSLEKVRAGDRIIVHTGEAVPVDGVIRDGDAILDQHMLTGESAPAEKTVGDNVFASTLLLAGRIVVEVERAGRETASSKISRILNKTIAYKSSSQSRGEHLADRAVIPALGIATLAGGVIGASAALAVVNSELGTGIRMAAPLGMLSSLTLCAQHGILVKDGRALEQMRMVDTVLFDKTGTLTREKPEVGRILCCGTHDEARVLSYAAAAEQKFTHPIAKAILERFHASKLPMPVINASKYQVGFGITVEIEGQLVRVGSRRFMEMENIKIPPAVQKDMEKMHAEGQSFVNVAIGGLLAGTLELHSSHRPEAEEIIAGLRARGVKHMAIISGDHERPTRALSERLGMDRYFAEVLPQDKARYVEMMQKEGRVVCFVGDGINDSIALKRANVSISLRGASSIATDTAQVVFLEDSLSKICALRDISQGLETNVKRSWHLILGANSFCVAGVFLFGFNIWHSVAFNNVSAFMALANGLLPRWRGDRALALAAGTSPLAGPSK